MDPRYFLRMAKWARKPPSATQIKIMLAIVALCLVIYGTERWFGWPDALTSEWTRPANRVVR